MQFVFSAPTPCYHANEDGKHGQYQHVHVAIEHVSIANVRIKYCCALSMAPRAASMSVTYLNNHLIVKTVLDSFSVNPLIVSALIQCTPSQSTVCSLSWVECKLCSNQILLQLLSLQMFFSSENLIHKDRVVCHPCRYVDPPEFCGLNFTWQTQMVTCGAHIVHTHCIALAQWSEACQASLMSSHAFCEQNKSLAQRNAESPSLDPGKALHSHTLERLTLLACRKRKRKANCLSNISWNRFKPRKP